MYICSSTTFNTQNVLRVLSDSVQSLPKNTKAVFFMKYILHSYKTHDRDAMLDGLESLFNLSPDLARLWAISKNTLTEREGERVNLLYKMASR